MLLLTFFSKDIARLQKHLKKMFAGITSIDIEEENLLVTALNSRKGERVELVKPVSIKVDNFFPGDLDVNLFAVILVFILSCCQIFGFAMYLF